MAENADTPDAELLRKLAAFLAKLPRESHLFWYRGGEWVPFWMRPFADMRR